MKVHIPKVGNTIFPKPSVSLLVYDEDSFGRKDLLGRALIEMDGEQRILNEGRRPVKYAMFKDPEWVPVYFDALDEQKGFVLAGFGLLEEDIADN